MRPITDLTRILTLIIQIHIHTKQENNMSFQKTPMITAEKTEMLLDNIFNTFNVGGNINTYQLQRIATGIVGTAIYSAVRNTKSKDGFQDQLMKHMQVANGIASHYKFPLDIEYNITREKGNFYKGKVPQLKSKMESLLIKTTSKYITVEDLRDVYKLKKGRRVDYKNIIDVMDELEFQDVTALDEYIGDKDYIKLLSTYVKEHKAELKKEYPDKSFTELKDIVTDKVDRPEDVPAFERLQAQAEDYIKSATRLADETWNQVLPQIVRVYSGCSLSALDGSDGYTGEDRYKLVQAILRSMDWSQKDSNMKLEQIAEDAEMADSETMVAGNLSGALNIIPECNLLIEEAEEVFKSNTSEEISREYENGVSDNLAGNSSHDYEVSENIPHGAIG